MLKKHIMPVLLMSTFVSGCSTLTSDGTSQNLSVFTYGTDNEMLSGANCELRNDYGTWTAITPASTMVHRSNKDLIVRCTKKGHSDGHANVVSVTKGNMYGNIIFGGGIGAIIDHNNGSAYEYPAQVKIYMGQSKTIQEGNSPDAGQGVK